MPILGQTVHFVSVSSSLHSPPSAVTPAVLLGYLAWLLLKRGIAHLNTGRTCFSKVFASHLEGFYTCGLQTCSWILDSQFSPFCSSWQSRDPWKFSFLDVLANLLPVGLALGALVGDCRIWKGGNKGVSSLLLTVGGLSGSCCDSFVTPAFRAVPHGFPLFQVALILGSGKLLLSVAPSELLVQVVSYSC